MAGNKLSRFERGSEHYATRLKEIPGEMAQRARKGAQLANLFEKGGIDINVYNELVLRYDPEAIESAIRDFGPEFRSHLPEEVKIPPELRPKESWLNRWENDREARQRQVPDGGKGAVEGE